MRVLILCLSLIFSSHTLACSQPITINYAPFVSPLVVTKFFGEFHQQLEQASGCSVSYTIQRDFEEFVMALFRREYTLAVVPGPYFNVLKQLDYSAVASQIINGPRKAYVIARKKENIFNMNDLAGRKVLVNSPLSASGSVFLEAARNLDLLKKMEIQHRNSYDNMMMSVLKGGWDAAVIITEYWYSLDERIRQNHLRIVEELEANVSTEFVILKERVSLAPMVYKALQSSNIEWGKPNSQATGPEHLEILLHAKLKEFQQGQVIALP